jgi:drug/metabolite transporter (DMT)-like permease
MTNWYVLSLIALLCIGIQRFLYKVAAERKCNAAWVTASFMATVTLLSAAFFLLSPETLPSLPFLLMVALINSSAFVIASITHIEALKRIPATVAYPLMRFDTLIAVLFSIVFFGDRLSPWQGLGLLFALVAITLFAREIEGPRALLRGKAIGYCLVAVGVLGGAVATISSKFAALYTNELAFMASSYLFGTVFSLALGKTLQAGDVHRDPKDAFLMGVVMGVANFVGFYSFLKALSQGPLSVIAAVTGMHFVISVILSVLIYREKLSWPRVIAIMATAIAVILLRN